jgi:hypothetical protein
VVFGDDGAICTESPRAASSSLLLVGGREMPREAVQSPKRIKSRQGLTCQLQLPGAIFLIRLQHGPPDFTDLPIFLYHSKTVHG